MRHRRKQDVIRVPIRIATYKAGDVVGTDSLFFCIQQYIDKLTDSNAALLDKIDELEQEKYDLQREIDNLHADIEEHYRPVDPYVYNGVSRMDF